MVNEIQVQSPCTQRYATDNSSGHTVTYACGTGDANQISVRGAQDATSISYHVGPLDSSATWTPLTRTASQYFQVAVENGHPLVRAVDRQRESRMNLWYVRTLAFGAPVVSAAALTFGSTILEDKRNERGLHRNPETTMVQLLDTGYASAWAGFFSLPYVLDARSFTQTELIVGSILIGGAGVGLAAFSSQPGREGFLGPGLELATTAGFGALYYLGESHNGEPSAIPTWVAPATQVAVGALSFGLSFTIDDQPPFQPTGWYGNVRLDLRGMMGLGNVGVGALIGAVDFLTGHNGRNVSGSSRSNWMNHVRLAGGPGDVGVSVAGTF